MANDKCKDCGCNCKKCSMNDYDVYLHVEIENLKQKLLERDNHIITMETNLLNEANKYPSGELAALKDELLTWQDKYERLHEDHKRVLRINQGLEEKLLKLADDCESDKTTYTKDIATISYKLAEANYVIKKLTEDNDRYKKDVSLAIQFLQCKQANFVAHKFETLPREVQAQVSKFTCSKKKPEEKRVYEPKSIKVPIPTFPPTAMVYSVPKSPNLNGKHMLEEEEVAEPPQVDIVSAAIMAKVLEERQKDKSCAKHCDTCTCSKNLKIIHDITHHSVGTQTVNLRTLVCMKCNEVLNMVQNPKIARTAEKTPTTANNAVELAQIVKVQPNNFRLQMKSPPPPEEVKLTVEIRKEGSDGEAADKESDDQQLLWDQKTPSCQSDESTKSCSDFRGPRYCSMRMQNGSRNILLDNAHSNIAPVLYTRHHHKSNPNLQDAADSEDNQVASSCSNDELKTRSFNNENPERNQQRVAAWIENNLDNTKQNLENTQLVLDNARYAEMEENVKRFLFGDSKFLKTIEKGKNKFSNYHDKE